MTDTTTITPAVRLRLAVAQTGHRGDPGDRAAFAAAGEEVRVLMTRAKAAGADLVQFSEATLCFPDKRRLSTDPDRMAEADWSRFAWDALESETARIAAHAGELGVWTVLGTQRRTGPGRPTTGLDVIDDRGQFAARYDERVLSNTKATWMYEAGTSATVVTVKGVRVGLTSGLEVHFPDLYAAAADDGVDVVLFSTAGPGAPGSADTFATEAKAHASSCRLWIGYAASTDHAVEAPSGVLAPDGWVARCSTSPIPDVVVADVLDDSDDLARAWRRSVRSSHPALARG